MTSSVAGAHWRGHPLFAHFVDPLKVDIHLQFETWKPATGLLAPVSGKTVRVVETDANGNKVTLKAVQPGGTVATDLQGTTDSSGIVSFDGLIVGSSGGLTLHFELDGLPSGTWSTAGWKSLDQLADGKVKGFSGNAIGTVNAPVRFLVGVPCWLNLSYQRYYGEKQRALFPSGTRIKIITHDKNNKQVDVHAFSTNSTSQYSTVLFDVKPGAKLLLLIFTRFTAASDDPSGFVLNPFSVTTGDQSEDDFKTAHDVLAVPAEKPCLYYDLTAGYAFHFKGWGDPLDKVPAWVSAVDTTSLCTWDAQAGKVEPLGVAVEMPDSFASGATLADVKLANGLLPDPEDTAMMTLCLALHAATLIREFHGLLWYLLGGQGDWQGLNLNPAVFETTLALTIEEGPHTAPIPDNLDTNPTDPHRGRVELPLYILFDEKQIKVAKQENEGRVRNFKNLVFHELGHCLMFSYSFDQKYDGSKKSDHLLNRFVDYSQSDWRVIPFWEGWAVFYSMLLLGPKEFLLSQLARIAAIDKAPDPVDMGKVTDVTATDANLAVMLGNIFPTNIIKTYQVADGDSGNRNLDLDKALNKLATLEANSTTPNPAGRNKGYASELCLAFSLYTLARFLVEREGQTMTAPGPGNGNGCLAPAGWYTNSGVQAAFQNIIFGPFWALKGADPSVSVATATADNSGDTVRRFTGFIAQAFAGDADRHKMRKIFANYYLMADEPVITAPAAINKGAAAQTIKITATNLPDISTVAEDGGLSIRIVPPSDPPYAPTFTLPNAQEIEFSATFAAKGAYQIEFIGRWGTKATTLQVVDP